MQPQIERLGLSPMMQDWTKREFLAGLAAALVAPRAVSANIPTPYSFDLSPPTDSGDKFVKWMQANRGEDPRFLAQRWSRFTALRANRDIADARNTRAFLMTPREEFVPKQSRSRSYEHAFLDIGYGVTISGPHLVGRMTSAINVALTDNVLEIGTGSGYQSAYLANLTDRVWTVEIVKELAERTRGAYDELIARGYTEYKAIKSKHADGYYGWEEGAPFDKIIVTCGIDHIPPPLLQQLKLGGTMVIPVGPPGAQRVLKVAKTQLPGGTVNIARSDIFGGKIVPFVPFRKLEGDVIQGHHHN
jgi:protein-L-isoaspartate(D-aspartate) O-methyltransferase